MSKKIFLKREEYRDCELSLSVFPKSASSKESSTSFQPVLPLTRIKSTTNNSNLNLSLGVEQVTSSRNDQSLTNKLMKNIGTSGYTFDIVRDSLVDVNENRYNIMQRPVTRNKTFLEDGLKKLRTSLSPQNEVTTKTKVSTLNKLQEHVTDTPQMLLSLEEDENFLTETQCLIRKNIEVFTAKEEDISSYSRGRNWKVKIGQVGIRCRHCKGSTGKERLKSSSYFPLNLTAIYQAAQNIYHFHFKETCPKLPEKTKETFYSRNSSRSGFAAGGKQYWIQSAKSLGVVETASGLWLKESTELSMQVQEISPSLYSASQILSKTLNIGESNIVNVMDKHLVTDYFFWLMCQMCQHVRPGDDEDSCCDLICKYCMGRKRCGAFVRLKFATMSKNDFFFRLHRHLKECPKCPLVVKKALDECYNSHEYQLRNLKRGSRKIFISRLLKRMKDNCLEA